MRSWCAPQLRAPPPGLVPAGVGGARACVARGTCFLLGSAPDGWTDGQRRSWGAAQEFLLCICCLVLSARPALGRRAATPLLLLLPTTVLPGVPVSPPYPPGVVTAPRFAWQRPGPAELPADRRPDRQDRGLRALALQVQSKAGLGEQGGQRWAWVGGGLRDTHPSPTLPCRARTAPAPCPLLGQWVGASPETTTLSCPCWLVPRQPKLRGTSRALLPKSAWAGFSPWKLQKRQGWGWEAEGEQWEEAGGLPGAQDGETAGAGGEGGGRKQERHGGAGGCRGSRAGTEGLGVGLWGGTAGLGGCGEAGVALWPVPYA